ncbi:MAG: ROK family protein [Candidatus Pacebacteria bacterium]|nr:ROK family protein [Candidatus Paceibacterota bacterium]
MDSSTTYIAPKTIPPLDPGFRPPVLTHRQFLSNVEASGNARPLSLAIEDDTGRRLCYRTRLFAPDHPQASANTFYAERLAKYLLWQHGGWKLMVGGAPDIANHLQEIYAPSGPRAFDAEFWGSRINQRPFSVVALQTDEIPESTTDAGSAISPDWKGWRIGFDLGASDRKVALVKDGTLALTEAGEPVLSTELPWDPRPQTDPQWHYDKIMELLNLANSTLQKVDASATITAIGGSSAGIYSNGRVRMASLFRGITSREQFEAKVAPLFERIAKDWGNIPFRIENDGDVTALAGAIALNEGAVLGLAMGSSLAAGYVDEKRRIRGWKNELAFAPVDYNPDAAVDEWSGDRGVGANYFSQQAVARLIPEAGLSMPDIPDSDLPARLVRVQEKMAEGDQRARRIYETIGCYLGYTIPHYCDFYQPVRHIELLGRVMTGEGGQIILRTARDILDREFPELAKQIHFYEPDEREKRHGQAAAAAHLPEAH